MSSNFIMRRLDIICLGFQIRVENGDVLVWNDNWSKEGHLCWLVDYVHFHDSYLQIKDVLVNEIW